ncbi:hypothetical protein BD779DRAFT_1610165 [Infundibulicybe gibba]|nr:hypothetical protein BD779DRAFT_1610165 [Infundibulicybe gibba]
MLSYLRPLHLAFGLSLLLQNFSGVYGIKGDSGCGPLLCLNATLEGDMPVGWIGLGFGRKMKGTHMVIMWPNEDGTTTLSQRLGTGHVEPEPIEDPPRVASIVNPRITTWHPTNSTSLSFRIPVNKTILASKDTSERLIWAYSVYRPSRFPESVLNQHWMAGFVKIDLGKDLPYSIPPTLSGSPPPHHNDNSESSPPSGNAGDEAVVVATNHARHDRLIMLHGALVSFGFLVLLPLGSLIARWGRTLTPAWFKAHWICNMLVALPVITFGWILGPISVMEHGAEHLFDAHQVCGALLLIIYYAQVALGRYIHRRKVQSPPTAKPHPPSNILHIVLGISTIFLAFLQTRSGMDEWQFVTGHPIHHWCHVLWNAWAVIVPVSYFGGFILLKRQFHQESKGVTWSTDQYIALSEGPSPQGSAVMFEAPEDDVPHQPYGKGEESAVPLLNSQRR